MPTIDEMLAAARARLTRLDPHDAWQAQAEGRKAIVEL